MAYNARNITILVLGGLCLFAVVAAIMLKVLPGPHKETDYLVIGAVSTLVTLLGVFVALINTTIRTTDVFYIKRVKQPDNEE